MEAMSVRKVAFPRYAEYNCAFRYIFEEAMDVRCIQPPAITRRTMELGAKHSPEFVCTPFKITLGSMIEALEAGADTLLMVHGLCRLGYYGELQEQILHDLGYRFDFINLSEYDMGKKKEYIKIVKRINPKVHLAKFAAKFMEGIRMVEYLDEVTAEYYRSCGFDATGQTIPINKPLRPLRVGIVGEFYTVMDAFSNLELEDKLSGMGVELYRWMNVTHQFFQYGAQKNMGVKIRDLCTYEMGPTATANIWYAKECAERGFDGLIHVKSAGCTPEIDVMPVLQTISGTYKVPVLYLTYDSQTSDVGLMTRLEAFYDMIEMRKKVL